jgi:hypothetical protein
MPLAELAASDREKVDDAVRRIVDACGSRLLGIALYGEAASVDYQPRRSPLSVVLLVLEVSAETLALLRPVAVRLRRRRFPTPLVVDSDYLERARDVFPLELLELRSRHAPLSGDVSALARIEIDPVSLRREIEAELRGKMLHLWEDYLTARTWRRLRANVLESVPYFLHILRGMLELKGALRARDSVEVAAEVEREYAVQLPMLSRLERLYREDGRLGRTEVEAVFAACLAEARMLAGISDRI